MSSHFKKIVKDAAGLSSSTLVGILISTLTTVLTARILGPEGRGVYTWMLTVASLAIMAATLGMDVTNRRLSGKHPEMTDALVGCSMLMALIGSMLVIPVTAFIALQYEMGRAQPFVLAIALAGVPFGVLSFSHGSLLIGINRTKVVSWSNIANKLLALVLTAFLIFMQMITPASTVATVTVSTIFSAGIALYYLRDKVHLASFTLAPLHGMWKFALSAYISGFLTLSIQKISLLMIGSRLSPAETGFYSITASLADMMIIPATMLGFVLLGNVAGLSDALHELKLVKKRAVRLTAAVMGAGCLSAAILAPWFVPLLFGKAFAPAVPSFQIQCAAVFLLSLYMVYQNVVNAVGRARAVVLAPLCGGLCLTVLNALWLPIYGINGAAYASVVANAVMLGCSWLMSSRHKSAA